jgi:hypothetical protein
MGGWTLRVVLGLCVVVGQGSFVFFFSRWCFFVFFPLGPFFMVAMEFVFIGGLRDAKSHDQTFILAIDLRLVKLPLDALHLNVLACCPYRDFHLS